MILNTAISRAAAVAAFAVGCWISLAEAHHSSSAFDTSKTVEWRAAVTGFKFVNPHAYVYFTMPDAAGQIVNGRCELSARTMLTHLGWNADTIRTGEKVTIRGAPGRNEANVCMLNSFVRADGTEVGAHQLLVH